MPSAKITKDDTFSIVSDYIGKPIAAYNGVGNLVWDVEYDIYGNIRSQSKGDKDFIPFRNQGQYEDAELNGLMYNRFRYYDGNSGTYISQDPIRIEGGSNLYSYVSDTNVLIDPKGLWGNRPPFPPNKVTSTVKAGDVVKSIGSDPKIAHSEIQAMDKIGKGMKGKDLVISDVIGDYGKKYGELPTSVCSNCRRDIFTLAGEYGANSVTLPKVINGEFKGVYKVDSKDFASVKAGVDKVIQRFIDRAEELGKPLSNFDSAKSTEAWKVFDEFGTFICANK